MRKGPPLYRPVPEPQYFTAFVSAIGSAVTRAPHPWRGFRVLIPLPSPVHLNSTAIYCKHDFMHDLFLLLPLPSPLPGRNPSGAPALVGSENVWCTIVALNQAARRLLSGLFTGFLSIRLICVPALSGFSASQRPSSLP